MCVVALALGVHPDWPIILVGNRDEFHARPSAPLHAWADGSGIVAGRDLQAGGTWLGVHPASGRITVVTNVRGTPPDPAKASRGALVTQLLTGNGPYAASRVADLDDFNAFNLMLVYQQSARIFTNRPAPRIEHQNHGIFALANEPAFAPCPRAEQLAALLANCVENSTDPHELLDQLARRDAPALFLEGEFYGTRASTLVLQNAAGEIFITERRYKAGGRSAGTSALQCRIG